MQRDLADGLPSELDAQVGAVVRMAQRVGADARLHHLVSNVLFISTALEYALSAQFL